MAQRLEAQVPLNLTTADSGDHIARLEAGAIGSETVNHVENLRSLSKVKFRDCGVNERFDEGVARIYRLVKVGEATPIDSEDPEDGGHLSSQSGDPAIRIGSTIRWTRAWPLRRPSNARAMSRFGPPVPRQPRRKRRLQMSAGR